jgi:glycosyltransferase involved in cell wall biosynthesis
VKPWLIVAGDLTPLGGMDVANHALAKHLASGGAEVHLVTHRAWPDLVEMSGVSLHSVWRPLRSHVLGGPLLARAGLREWRHLRPRQACAVVNGGNCRIPGANWVHYLHAAYEPDNTHLRIKAGVARRVDLENERQALQQARVIICNSRRTRNDVAERLGVPEHRLEVIYYGSDPLRFPLVKSDERNSARRALGASGRPLVGFVGALADRRKGFDTLFTAWRNLCARSDWDADLVVVGSGAERQSWQAWAREAGIDRRMHFLGFRADVPAILAALDVLVHPARYEAYGLSVHEAICRGVPAIVSAAAGVAEQYPSELGELLIEDPNRPEEVVERLLMWRRNLERYQTMAVALSRAFHTRTWDAMAAEIVSRVERAA